MKKLSVETVPLPPTNLSVTAVRVIVVFVLRCHSFPPPPHLLLLGSKTVFATLDRDVRG